MRIIKTTLMNENNEFLSNITLEYLMNKEQYAKYIEQQQPIQKSNYLKDKKFYKKRIYDITKKMLNGENPDRVIPDITYAFENYVRMCIEYLKMLDKTDILQDDYSKIDVEIPAYLDTPEVSLEESDQLFMRSFKIQEPNSLEKIVKRTSTKEIKKAEDLPKQKEINLKDPNLKKKGIKPKKKNIDNMYGEHQKNEEK